MEGALLLDVVIAESPTVLKLLASEDQPLLVRRNTLLVLSRLQILTKMSQEISVKNVLPGSWP